MAVDIITTFTDAQWALVQENYKNNKDEAITKEELSEMLFSRVKFVVLEELASKDPTDAFDV
jgi:hypothetical protein